MTLARVARLAGVALLVLVTNVVCSILYMVVYGYVIDPGHEQAYYDAHIQRAAPYCSIVAGVPLMFLAGWWVSSWWQRALGMGGAWTIWTAYVLIDLTVLLAAGMTAEIAALFAVSFGTKLAFVLLGAKRGLTQRVAA